MIMAPEGSSASTTTVRKMAAGRAQALKCLAVRSGRWSLKEEAIEKVLLAFTILSGILIFFIVFFVFTKALPVFRANGISFILSGGWDEQFVNAWLAPADQPSWQFGALPLIAGTVYTTAGALLIALPLGLGCAIFLVEMCPFWLRKPLKSTVRLLAAIPSVIYGLLGLLVVVPLISDKLISDELSLRMINVCVLDGTSLLAGMIVLSMMIVPIFIALAADALSAVPRRYKEASLSLGVSHWRTIVRIILPAARKGILAGAILATGRAVGEAIALSMVSGSVAHLPSIYHGPVFFLEPVRTLASTIVDNSEGLSVATCESALFACASFLLVSCILLSLFARVVAGGMQRGGGVADG
ncbi:MAG: phosphate ABC transporter permease subunit PstC [Peptococcaceae bacterium]|nr:phosphate ABC transporter permease subunit PstC [Peptococcaceae bacterium]